MSRASATKLLKTVACCIWIVFITSAIAKIAHAGPNQHGVIFLHRNEAIVTTNDEARYCGQSDLTECASAVTRCDGDAQVVLHALAAFPQETDPQVAGLLFGIQYDEELLAVSTSGNCGDDGYPVEGWPHSGSGAIIMFDTVREERLFEFYWITVYALTYDASSFGLGEVTTQGAYFLGPPPIDELDPIEDFGRMGFGMPGYLPCPGPVPSAEASWGQIKASFR